MKVDMSKKIIILYKEINDFMKLANKKRLDIYSACSAFYIFMSFIPFLVILLSIIPYLPFSRNDLEGALIGIVPVDYKGLTLSIINELYTGGKIAMSISIIAVIWASARGVLGITKGLNEIVGIEESRNFIYMRIRSAIYTLALVIGIVGMLILSVFGNTILEILNRYLRIPDSINNVLAYKNIFILGVLFCIFLFLFVALPNKRMVIKQQVPGALMSSMIWWLFTRLFSFYLTSFHSYSMYGSFAVVLIISIWLFTGMYIMFMGALFNEFLALKKGYKDEGKN